MKNFKAKFNIGVVSLTLTIVALLSNILLDKSDMNRSFYIKVAVLFIVVFSLNIIMTSMMYRMLKKSSALKKSISYLRPYLFLSIMVTLLSIVIGLSVAAPAMITKFLVDRVLIEKDLEMLLFITIAMIVITVFKGIGMYFRIYITAKISNGIVKNVREDLYQHAVKMSLSFYSTNRTGQVMSRFTNDVDAMNQLIQTFFNNISKFVTINILFTRVFYLDYGLGIVVIIIFPLIGNIMKKYSKKLHKTGKEMQNKIGNINSVLQESITGIRVIKAFGTEKNEIDKFDNENEGYYRAITKNKRIDAKVKPLVEGINSIITALVLFYGGYRVINSTGFTSGDLMSFLTSLGLMYDPVKNLTNANTSIQTKLPAAERIMEILDIEAEDLEKGSVIENIDGAIEFKDIYFKYDKSEEQTIKGVSFKAEKGEVIALVGSSGSGKSTLVNLIPRFFDLDSGEILIDGKSIKDLKISSLRSHIGIVPQDTFLFKGTIAYNIGYGNEDVTKEEIIEAAKMANAYNFIMDMPDGFDTEVGERGVLISGGQKQRLSIARALLKDPSILILDEATSALDIESERLVQDALNKLMKNRTTFVIAHRLSTIINADKILVMEKGDIIERGSHEELLEFGGKYKDLYKTQFDK